MYIIYKLLKNKIYCWDECIKNVDVKFISSHSSQSEASKMCNILNKENKDTSSLYKYTYFKDGYGTKPSFTVLDGDHTY